MINDSFLNSPFLTIQKGWPIHRFLLPLLTIFKIWTTKALPKHYLWNYESLLIPRGVFVLCYKVGLCVWCVFWFVGLNIVTVLCPLYYYHKKHPLNFFLLALFTITVAFGVGLSCAFTKGKHCLILLSVYSILICFLLLPWFLIMDEEHRTRKPNSWFPYELRYFWLFKQNLFDGTPRLC